MTQTLHERRVAVQAADAYALPGQVRERLQRIEQDVVALAEGHRGDAQQRPAGRGPGRELGGVDAGRGDMYPVGGQRVQLEQPPPAHALVVTMAAAAETTAPSRILASSSSGR